jgi:hypothetical protein
MEDRRRSKIATEFDLPQQPSNLITTKALRGQLLAMKFFDLSGRIRFEVAGLNQMVDEAADRNQAPVHTRHRLSLVPMEVISEIDHITDGDPLDGETFSVGLNEPTGELSQVVADRLSCVVGEIVAVEVFPHQRWFFGPDDQTLENIMMTILTGL